MVRRYLIELHRILHERFDKGEFQTLCFYLGVDYDTLPEGGLKDKARELIRYCERREQIDELVEAGRRLRPDAPWPGLSQDIPSESRPRTPLGPQGSVLIHGDVHGDVVTGSKTTQVDQREQRVDREINVAGDWEGRGRPDLDGEED